MKNENESKSEPDSIFKDTCECFGCACFGIQIQEDQYGNTRFLQLSPEEQKLKIQKFEKESE